LKNLERNTFSGDVRFFSGGKRPRQRTGGGCCRLDVHDRVFLFFFSHVAHMNTWLSHLYASARGWFRDIITIPPPLSI
jgi:hypothetical protein